MKNEDKASEIVIKIQNSSSLDYDGRRVKYMYDSAMEMAKWKDEQYKKEIVDLKRKLNAEKELRKQIEESVRGLPQPIKELIKAMNMVI